MLVVASILHSRHLITCAEPNYVKYAQVLALAETASMNVSWGYSLAPEAIKTIFLLNPKPLTEV